MNSNHAEESIAPQRDLTAAQVAFALAGIFAITFLYGRFVYAPCDDSYIFYVYAQNFVAGNGLTYNGTIVWGFTSILWVALLSVVGLVGVPIHLAGEILSALSGAFALCTTYLLGRSIRLTRPVALVPALLLGATGDFAFYSAVGLEQTLFVGFVALSAALVMSGAPATSKRITGIASVITATIMTRPEGTLLCGLLLLVWARRLGSIRAPMLCGLFVTGLMATCLFAMHFYYGDWLPNTFFIKSNSGFVNLPHGLAYLQASATRYGPVAALCFAGLIYRLLVKQAGRHMSSIWMLGITALWVSYVVLQGGDNMVGARLLIPILPLVYVSLVALADRIPVRAAIALVVILCTSLVASYALDSLLNRHIEHWRASFIVRQKAGIHLRDHFPSTTVVALNPAGITPYYSGLATIDMLGLNDRHIAHHGKRDHRLRFGHQAGDGDYVLAQKPDVILFGGNLSSQPGRLISEREIWASAEFHQQYARVTWRGIGTAYIKQAE